MNQVNENMNSEKCELKDKMIEQQEGYRIKDIEDKKQYYRTNKQRWHSKE